MESASITRFRLRGTGASPRQCSVSATPTPRAWITARTIATSFPIPTTPATSGAHPSTTPSRCCGELSLRFAVLRWPKQSRRPAARYGESAAALNSKPVNLAESEPITSMQASERSAASVADSEGQFWVKNGTPSILKNLPAIRANWQILFHHKR